MKLSLKAILVFCTWVVGSALSQPALAWWNTDFTYRKEVVLDTAASGGAVEDAVQSLPVLLRLDMSNFNFDDARADAGDLRFVAQDDHTPLTYSVESYDPQLGLATIWVDVPTLAAGTQTRFWMYFGNKKAISASSAAQTLDPQFHAVYHFGSGSSARQDATLNHNNITTPVVDSVGWIGRAAHLDGTTVLALPASASLAVDPAQGFTFEAWVKSSFAAGSSIVYANRSASGAVRIGLDQGVPFVEVTDKGTTQRSPAVAALKDTWNYLAVSGDAHSVVLYVNGESAATLQVALPALPGGGTLGGDGGAAAGGGNLSGDLDEVRLSSIARPVAYVKASFAAESQGSKLVRLGQTQQPAENGFGYFGVVFKNVTPDAWVVIAILCLMGVMSWVVMWQKSTYVGRTARANGAFMTYYKRLKGDMLSLDTRSDLSDSDRRELAHSSLYRLYRVGVAEIAARRDEDPRWVLTEETLEAVRATLDAAQVEEVQALDRGVVLLTISIAGAPFIGLLGTVLGVMITFAAIAASGEVNVNSIAPGIAAALLATVTGLAVAIPALFGYNYVSARNSDVAAKMQIFVDLLITRVAELQRRAATPRVVA
jgi:biopolymer transport protein ExbB